MSLPALLTDPEMQSRVRAAHARLIESIPDRGVRPVVAESWQRSLALLGSPASAQPRPWADAGRLADVRAEHRLVPAMPVLRRLLIEPAAGSGIVIAVTDELGHLLWVEGDSTAMRRAGRVGFVAGSDWSESVIGTSAPGTALARGDAVQIAGAEHFAPSVQGLSCTAMPIRDPDGVILGAVDITGGDDAADGRTLSLLRAAVAAAEAELMLDALRTPSNRPRPASIPTPPRLQLLGASPRLDGRPLTLRHAELLALLSDRPDGYSAAELAEQLGAVSDVTVRAELSRLRREVAGVTIASQPYRLATPLDSDVERVRRHLHLGHHRRALAAYRDALLPASNAPGVERIRAELSGELRECVLSDAGVEAVLAYLELPEADSDDEAVRLALRMLPAHSPKRSLLVARMQRVCNP